MSKKSLCYFFTLNDDIVPFILYELSPPDLLSFSLTGNAIIGYIRFFRTNSFWKKRYFAKWRIEYTPIHRCEEYYLKQLIEITITNDVIKSPSSWLDSNPFLATYLQRTFPCAKKVQRHAEMIIEAKKIARKIKAELIIHRILPHIWYFVDNSTLPHWKLYIIVFHELKMQNKIFTYCPNQEGAQLKSVTIFASFMVILVHFANPHHTETHLVKIPTFESVKLSSQIFYHDFIENPGFMNLSYSIILQDNVLKKHLPKSLESSPLFTISSAPHESLCTRGLTAIQRNDDDHIPLLFWMAYSTEKLTYVMYQYNVKTKITQKAILPCHIVPIFEEFRLPRFDNVLFLQIQTKTDEMYFWNVDLENYEEKPFLSSQPYVASLPKKTFIQGYPYTYKPLEDIFRDELGVVTAFLKKGKQPNQLMFVNDAFGYTKNVSYVLDQSKTKFLFINSEHKFQHIKFIVKEPKIDVAKWLQATTEPDWESSIPVGPWDQN